VTDPRTGQSPIMLGPVLVHQSKDYLTYHFLCLLWLVWHQILLEIFCFWNWWGSSTCKGTETKILLCCALEVFSSHETGHWEKAYHRYVLPKGCCITNSFTYFWGKSGPTFYEELMDLIQLMNLISNCKSLKKSGRS